MRTGLIERKGYVEQVRRALARSVVVALMGPRQCGKTTLARMIFDSTPDKQPDAYFDLESQVDLRRLANPEMVQPAFLHLCVLYRGK